MNLMAVKTSATLKIGLTNSSFFPHELIGNMGALRITVSIKDAVIADNFRFYFFRV
jgi:hypothetical protein